MPPTNYRPSEGSDELIVKPSELDENQVENPLANALGVPVASGDGSARFCDRGSCHLQAVFRVWRLFRAENISAV
jgi:hypothetical protein